MMQSSHQGLNGIKKFGTYRGSFICLNDDCPVYTVEWICNKVDFVKEKFCTPKPDLDEQRQVAAEKCKEMPPLNLELRNTPQEFQIDLIGWYVATGQLDKGRE